MKTFVKSLLLTALLIFVDAEYLGSAAAQNNFVVPPDFPGRFASNIRPAPTYIDARVLVAGVAETHTFPANARMVIFSADCNFYANPNGVAAVPAADVTTGVGSELNPTAYYYATPGVSISLIAATNCVVTMSFYLNVAR